MGAADVASGTFAEKERVPGNNIRVCPRCANEACGRGWQGHTGGDMSTMLATRPVPPHTTIATVTVYSEAVF